MPWSSSCQKNKQLSQEHRGRQIPERPRALLLAGPGKGAAEEACRLGATQAKAEMFLSGPMNGPLSFIR